MPLIMLFCQKFELYDYVDARKIHSGKIPRLGGIAIALGFFISAGFYLKINPNISLKGNLPVLCSALIIFAFALADDILNFHAFVKLMAQLAACLIVMFNNYRFTQILGWHLPSFVSYGLTFCWILGLINAFNLIDGMDGLCGSISFLIAITLGIQNHLSGNPTSGLCFIFSASILGFLCFNRPPAKIFMGDCGSQFLGFMIAILPLYPAGNRVEYNKFLYMVVLTAFPVFDTIAAILRRIIGKQPIFRGDKAHLHHKLLNFNYTVPKILCLIDGVQFFIGFSVILSYFQERNKATAILFHTSILLVMFFIIIHFSYKSFLEKNRLKGE